MNLHEINPEKRISPFCCDLLQERVSEALAWGRPGLCGTSPRTRGKRRRKGSFGYARPYLKENSFIPTKFHPLTRLWIVVATCYRVNMADNVLKIWRQLRAIQVRERDALLPSWQLWCWGKSCSAMIVAVSEDLESEKVSWWLVGM